MKALKTTINQFDLQKFLADAKEFTTWHLDPNYRITWVDELGSTPESGPIEAAMDQLQEGKFVFVPFSSNNVGKGIKMADGSFLKPGKDEKEDWGFYVSDVDSIGFVFQLAGDDLIIQTALNAGGSNAAPPPSVYVLKEVGVVDDRMEAYLRKYVKS